MISNTVSSNASKKSHQKSPEKKKKRERERDMYLMYYLNEDGKRVYTLKVRDDDYYDYARRVCLFLFLSFVRGETCGVVDLVDCLSLARACVGPEEEDFGFFFGLEFFDIILSLSSTIFLLCGCRRQ